MAKNKEDIIKMEAEASLLDNPDTFAKSSKIKR